jgi:hypothetical protein
VNGPTLGDYKHRARPEPDTLIKSVAGDTYLMIKGLVFYDRVNLIIKAQQVLTAGV